MLEQVHVNFARPMPLFPLPDTILLPHASQPLFVFEPRYRQMVEDALDGAGQFALATFHGNRYKTDYEGTPPLRPAVCVGQMIHHERLQNGCHNVIVVGLCRAAILNMLEPEGERLYRQAIVTPLDALDDEPGPMPGLRKRLLRMLSSDALQKMAGADAIVNWFDRDEVSTHALLELVGFALFNDVEVKYRLLAEGDLDTRAEITMDELQSLARLITRARQQQFSELPKGVTPN